MATISVPRGTMDQRPIGPQQRVLLHQGSVVRVDLRVPSIGTNGAKLLGGLPPANPDTGRPWSECRVFGVRNNPKTSGATGRDPHAKHIKTTVR